MCVCDHLGNFKVDNLNLSSLLHSLCIWFSYFVRDMSTLEMNDTSFSLSFVYYHINKMLADPIKKKKRESFS